MTNLYLVDEWLLEIPNSLTSMGKPRVDGERISLHSYSVDGNGRDEV